MNRIRWIDVAKAIGMFLVFYGHLLGGLYKTGVLIAFNQFKLINSFHMPLFFFISGFFYKFSHHYGRQIKILLLRRIIPVFFFGALLLPFWPLHQKLWLGKVDWPDIMERCLHYIHGAPRLNWITWFLVCLFICEMLATIFFPRCRTRRNILIFGISSIFTGLFICQGMETTLRMYGVPEAIIRIFLMSKNIWFIYEGVVALGFYAIGYALFPALSNVFEKRRYISYFLIPTSLFILLFSYKLNNPGEYFVVMLTNSSHGETIPFLVSSISGIVLIMSVAFILPPLKPILFIGQNTLILLGLNGIFHHFINVYAFTKYLPMSNWFSVTSYCIILTCFSLLICVPLIVVANKYIPQLIGKSYMTGPLLPNLEQINWKTFIKGFRRYPDTTMKPLEDDLLWPGFIRFL